MTADREKLVREAERIARLIYAERPFRAISEALRKQFGLAHNEPITWDQVLEVGGNHSGLLRIVRSTLAFADQSRPSLEVEEELVAEMEGLVRRLAQQYAFAANGQSYHMAAANIVSRLDKSRTLLASQSSTEPSTKT